MKRGGPSSHEGRLEGAIPRSNDEPAGQLTDLWRRTFWAMIVLTCAGLAQVRADSPPTYVGAQTCAGCHAAETDAWKGSHHALAMQPATEATVLGDFSGAHLEHFGVTTTFYRAGERFMLRTDGPDGRAARISDRLYVRRPAAAAVSDRDSRTVAIRRLASPGTRVPAIRVGAAGTISTRIRSWPPASRCTGPAATRPGTTCAPTVIRPTWSRTCDLAANAYATKLLRCERRLRGLPRPRIPPHRMGTVEAGRLLRCRPRSEDGLVAWLDATDRGTWAMNQRDRHRQTDGSAAFRCRAGCLRRVPHGGAR